MYDSLTDQQILRMLTIEVGGEDDLLVLEMTNMYWNAEAARTTRQLRYLYVKRSLLMMQLGRSIKYVDVSINTTDVKGSQFALNYRALLAQVNNELLGLDPTFDPSSALTDIQSQQLTSWWSTDSS